MPYRLPDSERDRFHREILELISRRNHTYISGRVTDSARTSSYTIYCETHDCLIVNTHYNYTRSRTGCLHCGRDSVSAKHTGRTFSQETLEQMRVSARERPGRGGRPRRWRETYEVRVWTRAVREAWNNQCAVTGQANSPGDSVLVSHHLISAHDEQRLSVTVENGICIHRELHRAFHNTYGYTGNTVAQFQDFILRLRDGEIVVPISSQGESGDSQGSETRVYDPARIMELHERLGEINDLLQDILQDLLQLQPPSPS